MKVTQTSGVVHNTSGGTYSQQKVTYQSGANQIQAPQILAAQQPKYELQQHVYSKTNPQKYLTQKG